MIWSAVGCYLLSSAPTELFELDDSQWQKILRRPEYAKRRAVHKSKVKQLALALTYNTFWLFFWA